MIRVLETGGPEARAEHEWRAIQSDHAALEASGEHLERLLGSLARSAPEDAAGLGVQGLLEEFQVRLLDHLAAEERKGLLERSARAEPRFARRVQSLRREHQDLRDRSHALTAGGVEVGWRVLHSRFVEFRRVLRAHELAENEVIQCAYLEDLGGRG